MDRRLARRRSPWWIREMAWSRLHGLAGKLDTLWRTDGLSEAQSHTLDAAISELEYRNRRKPPVDRCTCRLCLGPFDALCVDGARAEDDDEL